MTYNYQLGQTLSFDTNAAAVLGQSFDNVTVLSLMDPQSANNVIDIVGMHAAVYPYLVQAGLSVPDDPSQYNYIKVRTQSGKVTCLGMPWINESTIQAKTNQVITAIISGVTAQDVQGVQNALISNNYNQIKVTITPLSTTGG